MKYCLLKYHQLLFFILLTVSSKSQLLFHQENIKGGVCGDGISYYNMDYLSEDTIQLAINLPNGSEIKKAYLFSSRSIYQVGSLPIKDNSIVVKLNNNKVKIDSSNIITNKFNFDYSSPSGENCITANDVTGFVNQNNNILIKPCQGCLLISDTSRKFVYDTFYLLIIYENLLMPSTNIVALLNNKTYDYTLQYYFNNLNTINIFDDVSFSIWANNIRSFPTNYTSDYILNSSIGNFNLGTLDMYKGGTEWSKKLPGSFDYKNNTLTGLQDDTPDAFIDSTDALANIKTYLPSNANSFVITTSGNVTGAGANIRSGFFLAYTTPCPTSASKDTSISICRGQSVQLSASTGFATYNWYPKTGLTDSTVANPIANPVQSTNYIAYVKDAAGCMHTEHTQVIVHGAPVPETIAITHAVCGTQEGSITITPNYHNYFYTYSIGTGITTNTSFTNLSSGNYTLTVTDNAGCTYQTNFTINEINPANALFETQTATSSYTAPLYVHFINSSSGANNYIWNFPTASTTTFNSNYTFTNAGTYTVSLIAYNNLQQCADTAIKVFTILPQDTSGVFIPNVFSPNGDGINDMFEIKYEHAEEISMTIYDRWGKEVFIKELKNVNTGIISWNGKNASGTECAAGTYFYIVTIKADKKYIKIPNKEYKGFLSLLR